MAYNPILAYQLLQNCDLLPSSLFTQLAEQEGLEKIILSSVPVFLHDHYLGCAVKNDTLVVFVDSPTWASPIRFYSAEILTRFRKAGITKFESLRVKTQYVPQKKSIRHGEIDKTKIPSGKSIGLIKKNAQSIADPQLSTSLLRLALTLEQRNKDST